MKQSRNKGTPRRQNAKTRQKEVSEKKDELRTMDSVAFLGLTLEEQAKFAPPEFFQTRTFNYDDISKVHTMGGLIVATYREGVDLETFSKIACVYHRSKGTKHENSMKLVYEDMKKAARLDNVIVKLATMFFIPAIIFIIWVAFHMFRYAFYGNFDDIQAIIDFVMSFSGLLMAVAALILVHPMIREMRKDERRIKRTLGYEIKKDK